MALVVSDLIALASIEARDESLVQIPNATWLKYYNDAQRAICNHRPDAKAVVSNKALTANTTKQAIQTGAHRLLALYRNMGVDGTTIGTAITGPVPREMLDAFNPDWHKAAYHAAEVLQYVYEEASPLTFYAYPGPNVAVNVEGLWAMLPTDVAAVGNAMDISDIYAPACIEWMLYRAWAGDSERSPNWERAGRKRQSFNDLLGIKTQADVAVSPKVVERDKQA